MFRYIKSMNEMDTLAVYAQRRQEYTALKERVNSIRAQLQRYLKDGNMQAFRGAQFQADVLAKEFHRVQDSMLFLEEKVCTILPSNRPEN